MFVTLPDAATLFPLAVLLHVLDEWPAFPRWARRFGSPQYSDREYIVTHGAAVAFAAVSVVLVRVFPSAWAAFGFLSLVFFPSVLCNAIFHIGATALTRSYCPGVLSSALFYVPLSAVVVADTLTQGTLTLSLLVTALVVATIVHALEVGHTVFKRW